MNENPSYQKLVQAQLNAIFNQPCDNKNKKDKSKHTKEHKWGNWSNPTLTVGYCGAQGHIRRSCENCGLTEGKSNNIKIKNIERFEEKYGIKRSEDSIPIAKIIDIWGE